MARAILHFGADDTERLAHVRALRFEVFCTEQGVPADIELDALDGACVHFLLYENETPVATARVRAIGAGTFKLERMAVKRTHRSGGLGHDLMTHILTKLRKDGAKAVTLHAQTQVEEFYRRLGFVGKGEVYMEAGIPHRTMHQNLKT
jgi:predicted GNAT family N-acyltransferase